jgi:hypothetical protein
MIYDFSQGLARFFRISDKKFHVRILGICLYSPLQIDIEDTFIIV